jgi:hypothetical protein
MNHVTGTVARLANFIGARDFSPSQFITQLQDLDAEHADVLYHSNIRWLSFGKTLKRVWGLPRETLIFSEMKDENLKTDLSTCWNI